MTKDDIIEIVMGGVKPLALMCRSHEDVVSLHKTITTWADEMLRASQNKVEQRATNTASPKLPTLAEVEAYVKGKTFVGSYNGSPSKIEIAYDFICRQLRA
jgi:hypothetical protein